MIRRLLGLTTQEIVVPPVDRALLVPSQGFERQYHAALAAGDLVAASEIQQAQVDELTALQEARTLMAGPPLTSQPPNNQSPHMY